jgi:hypothetical protein
MTRSFKSTFATFCITYEPFMLTLWFTFLEICCRRAIRLSIFELLMALLAGARDLTVSCHRGVWCLQVIIFSLRDVMTVDSSFSSLQMCRANDDYLL